VAVFPSTVIEIFPVVALAGTTTVIDAPVTFATTEVIPLNFTMFTSPVALKLEPIIVTLEPTIPDMGEKLLTVGPPEVSTGCGGFGIEAFRSEQEKIVSFSILNGY